MGKLLNKIARTLLIGLSLLDGVILNAMATTEYMGLHYAPEENRPQKNEEITLQGLKIKVDASLVTTDVTVIGTAVPDLRNDDFIILYNGITQNVHHSVLC